MKKTGKLWVALITALSLAMPMNVWADTKISSISLKIDSSIEAGDSNNDVDVTTSSRYCSVDDVEVTNELLTSGRAAPDRRSRLHYLPTGMLILEQVLQKVIFLSAEMMPVLRLSAVLVNMS